MVNLFSHQKKALEQTKNHSRVLYALDLGLGKTFVATEKLKSIPFKYALVVVPKSLISQWKEHITKNYPEWRCIDYTDKKKEHCDKEKQNVILVNYDIVFRREELSKIPLYDEEAVLILDECVAISNPSAKRTKAILKMKFKNLIMLSGSVSKGKYENLYTLMKMLGNEQTKKEFYANYIIEKEITNHNVPFPIKIIVGYKNCEELREKMRKLGTVFMKTEDVLDLPTQNFIDLNIDNIPEYKKFQKDKIITINGEQLVGDCSLTQMLYERALAGCYNKNKLQAIKDLIESTDDRLIIFYNFWHEYNELIKIIAERPFSVVNGKTHNLTNYEKHDNSITLINYASGSSGLNLQLSNKIVYFTPPLSCEFYMQSLKRTHRLGQERPCFYYRLITKNSIENKIYRALAKGQDYTKFLFESEEA